MLLLILMVKKLLECFTKNNLKSKSNRVWSLKSNQEERNGKTAKIVLTVELMKKDVFIKNELFSRTAYPQQKQNRT